MCGIAGRFNYDPLRPIDRGVLEADKGAGFLQTPASYTDFQLRAEFWVDGAWLRSVYRRLAEFAAVHGGFTPSDARTLLDTTRKWIIPLLEALDKAGFSKRAGERRIVR